MCRSKHVEPLENFGIINSVTKPHLVGISTEVLDRYCFVQVFYCHGISTLFRGKGKGVVSVLKYTTVKIETWLKMWLHAFLNLALVGGDWSTSVPATFIHRSQNSGTHWAEHCMGSRLVWRLFLERKSDAFQSIVFSSVAVRTDLFVCQIWRI